MDKLENVWQSINGAKFIPFSFKHGYALYEYVLAFSPSVPCKEIARHFQEMRDARARGCSPEAYFYGPDFEIVGKVVTSSVS